MIEGWITLSLTSQVGVDDDLLHFERCENLLGGITL